MPPRSSRTRVCQICNEKEQKYTCSACYVVYCSVQCYKEHKANSCTNTVKSNEGSPRETTTLTQPAQSSDDMEDEKPLRPLTSLNWPYVPEQSSFSDPLERDKPKPLRLHQYEAIATSVPIRKLLEDNPNLKNIILEIDNLRGVEREQALYRALGVTAADLINPSIHTSSLNEDTLVIRQLAEAIESAVRGDEDRALGLDWGD